ncbi:MAG: 6-carboxytetrahydropterin synthase QueD [Peptostreptococcaceae bacterium]
MMKNKAGDVIVVSGVLSITKEFTFDSCHYLKMYEGKCANLHGHTYKLQITITGDRLYSNGLLLDFGDLKTMVNEHIIDKVDHKNLSEVFDFNTTAELMVTYFSDILDDVLNKHNKENNDTLQVSRVRLWETPTSYATFDKERVN